MSELAGSEISRTAASSVSDWYLVQLRPNQKDRARANLERQGYPCFCPQRPVTARRRGKLVTGLGPLFPGYMFLQIAPDRQWRPVNSTYGVVRLVMRRANMPQPVPGALMHELFAGTDADGVIQPATSFEIGDAVRIAAGPLAGIAARVATLGDADRIGVLLEIMGQAVRTELPRAHLDRLAG